MLGEYEDDDRLSIFADSNFNMDEMFKNKHTETNKSVYAGDIFPEVALLKDDSAVSSVNIGRKRKHLSDVVSKKSVGSEFNKISKKK